MKLILLSSLVFSLAQLCSAAACTSGSLASYISLGASGCTIGGSTVSNFGIDGGTSGAVALSSSSLSINPLSGAATVGFSFSTTQTAGANMMIESIFTYQISGSSYDGASISLANASETGDGAVTDQVNFCAGGAFGPGGTTGCTGSTGTLLTIDPFQLSDQSSFSSTHPVSITNDFILDGGTAGSAIGGTFTNSLSLSATAAPEPSSFLFVMAALGVAAATRKRITKLNLVKNEESQ